jgi:single stranded DNA-binding protein
MQTLNVIQVVGNIGVDAKMIDFPNGGKKTILSVATNTGYGDNQKTQWHTVLLYNKSAEICSGLVKGDVIWCSGYMDYRKWTDDEGIVRIVPEIHAEKFSILKGQPVKPTGSDSPTDSNGSYGNLAKNESSNNNGKGLSVPKAPVPELDPSNSKLKDLPY